MVATALVIIEQISVRSALEIGGLAFRGGSLQKMRANALGMLRGCAGVFEKNTVRSIVSSLLFSPTALDGSGRERFSLEL